ncbi:MAG: hypothetical protein ACYDBJ_10945 [Aggregatilineales bacterium]
MLAQPHPYQQAFGETFGLDVPTRYTAETHALFNTLMAADAAFTPALLHMSRWTRWICRALAALLLVGRASRGGPELRQQLQIEAAVGLFLIVTALTGHMRFLEKLYCLVGGLLIVANSLMTQVE